MSYVNQSIEASLKTFRLMLNNAEMEFALNESAAMIVNSLNQGGRLLICGNGGSAADAQHIAAELSGRFAYNRPPIDAEALHVNTSYLTAVANDYHFDTIYERLVQAKGRPGDVLLAISTSGNSPNVVNAVIKAGERGMLSIGLTGQDGGTLRRLCNQMIMVPASETARIQEAHILCGHILCGMIEKAIYPAPETDNAGDKDAQ